MKTVDLPADIQQIAQRQMRISERAAVIEARRVRRVEGGDHSIFIAEVT